MKQQLINMAKASWRWLTRDEHRKKAAELRAEVHRAFTEHPADTGETYPQHLWFTTKMAFRFLMTMLVVLIHGVFPFLLMRTSSAQIEDMYRIMKKRIPKSRRQEIDADDDLRYTG